MLTNDPSICLSLPLSHLVTCRNIIDISVLYFCLGFEAAEGFSVVIYQLSKE